MILLWVGSFAFVNASPAKDTNPHPSFVGKKACTSPPCLPRPDDTFLDGYIFKLPISQDTGKPPSDSSSEKIPVKTGTEFPLYAILLAIGAIAIALMLTLPFKKPLEPEPKNRDETTPEPPLPEWLIVDHSAIGKDHIRHNTPCQDSRYIERIGQHWGVAVCCDGAGSAANSDQGSRFVAEQTAKILAYALKKHEWPASNKLPDEQVWKTMSVQVLHKVYTDLESHARKHCLDIKSLACTVIAVIYSPMGLLVTHIGDGRAAYCNEAGVWQAIITPFKGEEANQTVFITSSIWQDTDNYIESRIIAEPPFGFTLLSDGCEDFAFLTYTNTAKNPGEIKVEDVNQPFDGFYRPLVRHFKDLHGKVSNEAMQAEWAVILERGTAKIKDEPDDKTMILGIRV